MSASAEGPSAPSSKSPVFSLLISGQLESGFFPAVEEIYCKYSYVAGVDWRQVCGLEEGISQICHRQKLPCGAATQRMVLNCPLEATFTSTCPFGWPQLVLTCFGRDALGNDVVRGYGATHLPTIPGATTREVPIFVPQASTLIGYLTGRRAEFVDSRITAMPVGREVTRVSTHGHIRVTLSVALKDMKKLGYDAQSQGLARVSEFPLPNFHELLLHSTTGIADKEKGGEMKQGTFGELSSSEGEHGTTTTRPIERISEEEEGPGRLDTTEGEEEDGGR